MAGNERDLKKEAAAYAAGFKGTRVKTGHAPIRSEAMSIEDFIGGFRALDSANAKMKDAHEIRDIAFPVWNGGTLNDGTQMANNKANITINFNRQSKDAFPDSKGTKAIASVAIINDSTVRVDLDTAAFAQDTIESKEASGKYEDDDAKKRLETQKDRVPMTFNFINAKNGVAGITAETMTQNVGKLATQRFVLYAPKKGDPSVQRPSTEMIQDIGSLYNDKFVDFMGNLKKYTKDLKDKDGQTIEGYKVSLDKFDAKVVDLNGVNSFVIVDAASGKPVGKDRTSEVNDWLRGVGQRFNREMSKTLYEKYPTDPNAAGYAPENRLALNIAKAINIAPYGVAPQHNSKPYEKDIMLVQPQVVGMLQPYATSLDNAHDVAVHNKTPEEAYTAETLSIADAMSKLYNGINDRAMTKEEKQNAVDAAMKAADTQFEALDKAMEGLGA